MNLSSSFPLRLGFCLVVTAALAAPCRAAAGDEHWDGQFGWPGTTNIVYSIRGHQGRLYAGGTSGFSGVTNTTLSVWDGSRWSGLGLFGGGSLQFVYDLASFGGHLYVGGLFRNVDGVPAVGLARWDGQSWSSVGFNGAVLTMAVDGNNLY